MEIQAALLTRPGDPLTVATLEMDDPAPDEVVVRTVASGLCHSDLHIADGSIFPGKGAFVLGHEGAGVVEAVGSAVTHVAPGDHVVTCLSGFCGQCAQCLSGHPNLCAANPTGRPRGEPDRLRLGDERVRAFVNIGGFADHMLLHEHSVVKIEADLSLAAACLVGCGVLTGVGAALRTARIQAGDTVAVFGCGGVGLSIVQAATLAGARRIIAVDRVAAKLEMARSLGATDTVDGGTVDAVEAIRELTGGAGVDHALEAVGNPALVRQAVEALAVRGTCTIVGVPADGTVFEIPYAAIRPECRILTSRMGSTRFRIDIPRYLDFYRQGRLDLEGLISRRIDLAGVNDAFAAMAAGDGARSVIVFDGA
jgi:S-(hydroxymethyl)glutathione dehydrogenase/alcohol dehydrogenase